MAPHDHIMDYFSIINNPYSTTNTVITLHGYLRIVEPQVCEAYDMYNGHPGLIDIYPELKGKDPQVRAYTGKYPKVGSVIHKVTAGVDEGPIIHAESEENTAGNIDEMYSILRRTSLKSWKNTLKDILTCE